MINCFTPTRWVLSDGRDSCGVRGCLCLSRWRRRTPRLTPVWSKGERFRELYTINRSVAEFRSQSRYDVYLSVSLSPSVWVCVCVCVCVRLCVHGLCTAHEQTSTTNRCRLDPGIKTAGNLRKRAAVDHCSCDGVITAHRWTDRRTDGQTDGLTRTGSIPPPPTHTQFLLK